MTLPIKWIPSPNFNKGRLKPVRIIVIHTAEAAEYPSTAENVAKYFQGPVQASDHYCVDNDSIAQSVKDEDTAWAAPGANSDGLQFEHAGRAAQGVTGWGDAYSKAMLDLSAQLTAEKATKYGIPVRRLTPAQIVAGEKGFAGHVDINAAYRRSSHTDPGPTFPWNTYLAKVRFYQGNATPPKETKPTMTVTANGWPLKESGLVAFTAPDGRSTSVASQELAYIFAYATYRWNTELEQVTSCWGNRTVAGQHAANPAVTDSNHMSATAIDVNGAKHPYQLTHPGQWDSFTSHQMTVLRDIIKQSRILQTGMDFPAPYKDGMHLQVRESSTRRYSRVISAADAHSSAVRLRDWAKGVQRLIGATQDGMMGPGTLKAVKAFQSKHGLTQDGVVGPATRAAGNKPTTPTSKPTTGHPLPAPGHAGAAGPGDTGAAVTSLQQFLLHKGFPEVGKADGDYGKNTVAAVKRYQQIVNKQGEKLGADGIVGPRTLAVMKSRGWK